MNSYLEIEISQEEFLLLQQFVGGMDYINVNLIRYPGFVSEYLLQDRSLNCVVTLTELGKKCHIDKIGRGVYVVRIPVVDKRAC